MMNLYRKLLRKIQQKDISLADFYKFREENPNTQWTEIVYPDTGDSILHHVSKLGREDLLSHILFEWSPFVAGIDLRNNDGKTALHVAAQCGQAGVLKILLENGAEINAIKRADWTPLMLACTKNNLEIIKTLVENARIRVELRNKDGWNCFHLACRVGCIKIVQFLLSKSKIQSTITQLTNNGRSALHIACLHGHVNIFKLLRDTKRFDLNIRDKCGNTPITDGVLSNNIELVNDLVRNGADINNINNASLTLLHLAAGEGLMEISRFLITELKLEINYATCNGVTALHCAARNKQIQMYDLLIKLGAKENLQDHHNRKARDYINL